MTCATEFEVIDIIVKSSAKTRGVDAFCLSLIKAERQIRKLTTYLIFQSPCFSEKDVPKLRQILANNNNVYFEGFERGFNAIYSPSVERLVGDKYAYLRERIEEGMEYRNKIFHGQLTKNGLGRNALLDLVSDIRCWCTLLADNASSAIGFDGFEGRSFRKITRTEYSQNLNISVNSMDDYAGFIRSHMQRRRRVAPRSEGHERR